MSQVRNDFRFAAPAARDHNNHEALKKFLAARGPARITLNVSFINRSTRLTVDFDRKISPRLAANSGLATNYLMLRMFTSRTGLTLY